MQIGPPNIYKCPDCGIKHSNPTLMSGNTFGAIFYSDGYFVAPMMPKYPFVTRCSGCGSIFWLDERNLIDIKVGWRDKKYFDEDKYPRAVKLDADDYIEAINNKIYTSDDDEFLLRQQLWWKMNDSQRYVSLEECSNDESYENIRRANILRLIDVIESCRAKYKTNPESMMLILAELYRSIGNFDACINVLKFVDNQKYKDYVEMIGEACHEGCVKVLEITKNKKV